MKESIKTRFMQRYVDYLLDDIDQAKENLPVFCRSDDHEMLFISPQEEKAFAPQKPLGEWLQLNKIIFPPVEKLSHFQIKSILLALEDLLLVYNYILNFPTDAKIEKKYEVLINHFDQPTPLLVYNFWQINLCENLTKICPFESANCPCNKRERIIKDLQEEETTFDLEAFLEHIGGFNLDKEEVSLEFGVEFLEFLREEVQEEEYLWSDEDFDEDFDLDGAFEFWEDGED